MQEVQVQPVQMQMQMVQEVQLVQVQQIPVQVMQTIFAKVHVCACTHVKCMCMFTCAAIFIRRNAHACR
jgi:hypothetical protein